MKRLKVLLGFCALTVVVIQYSIAQTAVNAQLTVSPPYSVYLNDYAASGSNRIRLNLIFSDKEIDEVRVKLRFKLEGTNTTIKTRDNFRPSAPIILSNGIPEILTSDDLGEYFNTRNWEFQGEGYDQFQRTTRIPEDYYKFCVQVVDYDRNTVLLEYKCGPPNFIVQNNPPVITQINSGSAFVYMPVSTPEGNKVEATNPQIVNLQWSSNSGSSPNSALNTSYELQIVEVTPDDRDPNEAFRTHFIYTIADNLTDKNFVIRSDDYNLQIGKSYAVRIRATDGSGLELFKNLGYSPPIKFKYGERCLPPFEVSATTANFSQSRIIWTQRPGNTEYTVKYREKGQTEWYTATNILFNNYQINNLKAGKQYEYQVLANCGSIVSEESDTYTFSIPVKDKDAFVCGPAGGIQTQAVGEPLASLRTGDEINAGKYTVYLTEVTGGNGLFSGKGYVSMPFLNNAKLQVAFSNVYVNTNHTATKGVMRVTGTGVQAIPDGAKEQIRVVTDKINETTTKVGNALNTIEDVTKDAQKQITEAQKTLDEVKNLPQDARKAIEDGKSMIAQGKAMVEAGNSAQGENLIEQGKKKLSEGAKIAVDAAKNGGATVANIVQQGADKLKELVQKVLNAKKTESESGKTASTSDATKEGGELSSATAAIHKERESAVFPDDDPNEESEIEDAIAWEVEGDNRPISKTEEEGVAKLSGRNRALMSMNKIINYLDKLSEYEFILTIANNYLKEEALLKLVNEIKEDAPDAAKQLIQGYLSGKGTADLEKYIKEYIDKKINEQLTNAQQK